MLDYCISKARETEKESGKQRVYACITNSYGICIAESKNLYSKSHPLQKKYSVEAGFSEERCYLHAELACIIKAAKKNPSKCTLYVARIGKSGKPLDALPCPSCRLAIKSAGFITSIQYTVGG